MAIARKKTVRGLWIRATRKARELRMVASALLHTGHPVLVQIVPARFCNLSCGYCNEYDKVSEPVALDEMIRRIDHLGQVDIRLRGSELPGPAAAHVVAARDSGGNPANPTADANTKGVES